jgi:hypothetical protein
MISGMIKAHPEFGWQGKARPPTSVSRGLADPSTLLEATIRRSPQATLGGS